mmetsp:Transcript_10651/g.12267  ORF Transcript_10651/g.12267 Transcript_10651/m.12267 type:complete len:190 (-) Transcript_10651:13-582(-)
MDRRKISESKDKKSIAMNKESPFYLMARPTEKALGMKEISRKREMDPMKDFIQENEDFRNASEISCNKEDQKEESSRKRKRIKEDHDSRENMKKRGHKKKDYFKNRSRVRCKKKKSNKDVSDASSESTDRHDFEFVEQLRKKRSEREQKERRRQDAILDNSPYSHRDRNKNNGGYSYHFNSDLNNRRSL